MRGLTQKTFFFDVRGTKVNQTLFDRLNAVINEEPFGRYYAATPSWRALAITFSDRTWYRSRLQ